MKRKEIHETSIKIIDLISRYNESKFEWLETKMRTDIDIYRRIAQNEYYKCVRAIERLETRYEKLKKELEF